MHRGTVSVTNALKTTLKIKIRVKIGVSSHVNQSDRGIPSARLFSNGEQCIESSPRWDSVMHGSVASPRNVGAVQPPRLLAFLHTSRGSSNPPFPSIQLSSPSSSSSLSYHFVCLSVRRVTFRLHPPPRKCISIGRGSGGYPLFAFSSGNRFLRTCDFFLANG